MRQFILGANVAYPGNGTEINAIGAGAVGFAYIKSADGKATVTNTGTEITNEGMLVLGRKAENGGPVVIPIYKNKFSFAKGVYQAATKFTTTLTIPAPTKVGDYSVIVVKQGTKFNERNKWTASVHVTDTTMEANALATALRKAVNGNVGSGVKATGGTNQLILTAEEYGVGYTILGADELMGLNVPAGTKGVPAYGDANYVRDLANKAAADAGFEYTYREANFYMYPGYDNDPLAQPAAQDKGYDIFTLRFAEPRKVATRDDVVSQVVQVAFPHGAAAVATFETVCKAIAGENTPA